MSTSGCNALHHHGDSGEGVVAMSLNNAIFHELASDGFIYHAIAKGRPGTPLHQL